MICFIWSIRWVRIALLLPLASLLHAQRITTAGQPAPLDIRAAGDNSIRITLTPLTFQAAVPHTPALAERTYPRPAISVRQLGNPIQRKVAALNVLVKPQPLTISISTADGTPIQEIVFDSAGNVAFPIGDSPALGMGEGGPRPEQGSPWREQPVQFDRRGQLDMMELRWQADMYGSRNPSAMLLGTSGWATFALAQSARRTTKSQVTSAAGCRASLGSSLQKRPQRV